MPKWEYLVKGTTDGAELQSTLNEWAKTDWELVTVYPRGSSAVFVVFRKKIKE